MRVIILLGKCYRPSYHKKKKYIKVKGSLLQAMKAHGESGCIGPHTATALGRGRVASPTLDRLYAW